MSESGEIGRALAESLAAVPNLPEDEAGVALARRLADLLDGAWGTDGEAEVFNDLAPKLLACLTALGLTPAGRGKGGERGVSGGGKLDELRARRQQRAGGD